MNKILPILFLLVFASKTSYQQVTITSTTIPQHHGCPDGSITMVVSSPCGALGLCDSTGLNCSSIINGTYTFNAGAGHYSWLWIANCGPNDVQLGNVSVDLFPDPPCNNTSVSVDTIKPVTNSFCTDGEIKITAFSADICFGDSMMTWKLFKNNSVISQSNSNNQIISGHSRTFSGLDTGYYHILVTSGGTCFDSTNTIHITGPSGNYVPCSNTSIVLDTVKNVSRHKCADGEITISASSTDICNGQFIHARLYKKNWSFNEYFPWDLKLILSGQTTTFSGLDTGLYYVVAEAGNCYDTTSIIHITAPPPGNITVIIDTITNVSQYQCYNGSIKVNVAYDSVCSNSDPNYVVSLWGNGYYQGNFAGGYSGSVDTGFTFSSLDTGYYFVVVNNYYHQDTTVTIHITQPPPTIVGTIDGFTNVTTTNGCPNGTLQVSAVIGCAPYTANLFRNGNLIAWRWAFPGDFCTFDELDAGYYFVVVKDFDTYVSDTTNTIQITSPPQATNIISSIVSFTNITKYGCSNGMLNITAVTDSVCTWGLNYLATLYKNGQPIQGDMGYSGTTITFSSLDTGYYYVVVGNGFHEDTTATIHITEPSGNINATLNSFTNITKYRCSNGRLKVTAYTDSVCSIYGHNYYAQLYKNGQYVQSDIVNSGTSVTFGSLDTGYYYVIVGNGFNEDTTITIHILEPSGNIDIVYESYNNISNYRCHNGILQLTAITDSVCGMGENYYAHLYRNGQYLIGNGNTSYSGLPTIFSSLDTGYYFVIVGNGFHEDISNTIHISEPSGDIDISFESYTNVTKHRCSNGTLQISANTDSVCSPYGKNYYAHIYKGGQFIQSKIAISGATVTFSSLDTGSYFVVVGNGFHEDTTATIHITEPNGDINATLNTFSDITKFRCSDGTLQVTAISDSVCSLYGQNYYAQLYRDGQYVQGNTGYSGTSITFSSLDTGYYYVVVGNGFNEDTTNTIHISEPSCQALSFITYTSPSNSNCNNGSITITANSTYCNGDSSYYVAQLLHNGVLGSTSNYSSISAMFNNLSSGNYRVTVANSQCTDTSQLISINCQVTTSVNVNLKAFIQGYYLGSQMLAPVLFNQGVSTNNTVCDSITVELHSQYPPYSLVASKPAILYTNGTAACQFQVYGIFYLVVKHRNATEIWSANPVFVTNNVYYDFTNNYSKVFGDNEVEVEPNIWASYSGDINQDGSIDAFDFLILDPDIFYGDSGYLNTDLNGDGSVDAFDYLIIDSNIFNGITVVSP